MKVYIDLSGSMFEMGGKSALEYICKSLKDCCEFKGIECGFYDFEGNEIDIFDLSPKPSEIQTLKKILKEDFNVIITDGYFEGFEKLNAYALAFSIAADKKRLRLIAKEVFDESEIIKLAEYYISTREIEDEW